ESLEETLRLYNVMVEKGLVPKNIKEVSLLLFDIIDNHIYPNQYSYAILTKGLNRNGNLTEALKFHR
ncbi:hypothetical protein HN51_004525, partial [Arachis hypogaea]